MPLFVLLRIVRPGGLDQILIYGIILALCGTCLAGTSSSASVESTLVIDKYHKANSEIFGPNGSYAQIVGIIGLIFNIGTCLGPLLAGALKDAVGYGNMNLVIAGLSLITALLGFFFTGGKPVNSADWSVTCEIFWTRSDTDVQNNRFYAVKRLVNKKRDR